MNRVEYVLINGEEVSINSVDVERNIERKYIPLAPDKPAEGVEERTTTTEVTIFTSEETDLPDPMRDGVKVEVPGHIDYELDYMEKREVMHSYDPGNPLKIEEELVAFKKEIEVVQIDGSDLQKYRW